MFPLRSGQLGALCSRLLPARRSSPTFCSEVDLNVHRSWRAVPSYDLDHHTGTQPVRNNIAPSEAQETFSIVFHSHVHVCLSGSSVWWFGEVWFVQELEASHGKATALHDRGRLIHGSGTTKELAETKDDFVCTKLHFL